MNIEIKQLNINDIDLLIQLRMEVLADVFKNDFEKMTDTEIEKLKQENRNYYLNQLTNEGHIVCVVYNEKNIIGCGGMCLYNEMPSPDNINGKCAYLMNIYVKPNYRKQGIGKKICSWLIEQAKSKNITKIYLETSDNAKSMYKKLGFEEMKNYLMLKS